MFTSNFFYFITEASVVGRISELFPQDSHPFLFIQALIWILLWKNFADKFKVTNHLTLKYGDYSELLVDPM